MAVLVSPARRLGGRLRGYSTMALLGPFAGFTSWKSPDTIPQGQEGRPFMSPDLLNMLSWPFGSMTSFPGHANINTSAASGGAACTGITYEGEIAQTLVACFQDDLGDFNADGVYTSRLGTLTLTDSADNLADFAYLNNRTIVAFRNGDAPAVRTGGSGNFAALGGSPRASVRYAVTWDGRLWLFSDQNADWSARNDPTVWDLTDDTLNFLGVSGAGVVDRTVTTGARVAGDAIYVGKEGINAPVGHMFRIYKTGDARQYAFERIETGGIAPISQQAFLLLPNGDLAFLAKDGSIYILRGNVLMEIGRNIKRTLVEDYSKTRFRYASMGLLRERGLLGLSVSLAGSTTHGRTWWYDYINSIPSALSGTTDTEFWSPGDHAINAWGERISSGQLQLVTGGYDGFIERHLSGNSYAGSAFTKRWTLPWLLLGDYLQVYHVLQVIVVFQTTGGFNVTLNYRTNFGQEYTSSGTFAVGTGAFILDTSVLDTGSLGGLSDVGVAAVTLNTVARRLQLQFVNANVSEPYNIYAIYLVLKPRYRGVNV